MNMARRPIDTAPKDGSKVEVCWTDRDGQENQSVAHYRSLEKLRMAGGDWDEADAGWWAYVDSETQKKISPHSWMSGEEGDE
jgi:hypothetical protein